MKLHPKQICKDFESLGSPLSVDGNNIFIENPDNVYPELEEFAKSYKTVLVKFLKGEYTDQHHHVNQTIEKIINFYRNVEQPMNKKINEWLNNDEMSLEMVMTLWVRLSENGWSLHEPAVNYQNEKTQVLSLEIYNRAMVFFKGG